MNLVSRELVDEQVLALGDGADFVEQGFGGMGARLHVDDHVGVGECFLDRGFDLVGDLVDALKGGGAGDGNGDVDEGAVAGAAGADAVDAEHAVDAGGGGFYLGADAGGRSVGEDVHAALGEAKTDVEHGCGHDQRRHRVGVAQPGDAEALAGPDGGEAEEHHQRGPQVGGEVEGVGFEGLGVVLAGHAHQGAGAEPVDAEREEKDQEGEEGGLDLDPVDEAMDGFPDDPGAGDEEQRGLEDGAEVFELGVAVGVVGVGGLVGDADGEVGDDGGDEVEAGVGRLGEHAQAVRAQADDGFHRQQDHAGEHAGKRDGALLALGFARSEIRSGGIQRRRGGISLSGPAAMMI